jgi:hypothetical protein
MLWADATWENIKSDQAASRANERVKMDERGMYCMCGIRCRMAMVLVSK